MEFKIDSDLESKFTLIWNQNLFCFGINCSCDNKGNLYLADEASKDELELFKFPNSLEHEASSKGMHNYVKRGRGGADLKNS